MFLLFRLLLQQINILTAPCETQPESTFVELASGHGLYQ